jgi:hypothetical protein
MCTKWSGILISKCNVTPVNKRAVEIHFTDIPTAIKQASWHFINFIANVDNRETTFLKR